MPFSRFSQHFYDSVSATDKKLPVVVFLHGESFEWNSGNPYDGTVLASYGEVVVVTLNYRLGILGKANLYIVCLCMGGLCDDISISLQSFIPTKLIRPHPIQSN